MILSNIKHFDFSPCENIFLILILILVNIESFVLELVKYIDIEVGAYNNRFCRYFEGLKLHILRIIMVKSNMS